MEVCFCWNVYHPSFDCLSPWQSRHMVFWNNCSGACSWSCTFFQVPSYEGTHFRLLTIPWMSYTLLFRITLWLFMFMNVFLYCLFRKTSLASCFYLKSTVIWWHLPGLLCHINCSVPQVLLMTLQNAPPGLDYERDKKFSKVRLMWKLSFIYIYIYKSILFALKFGKVMDI